MSRRASKFTTASIFWLSLFLFFFAKGNHRNALDNCSNKFLRLSNTSVGAERVIEFNNKLSALRTQRRGKSYNVCKLRGIEIGCGVFGKLLSLYFTKRKQWTLSAPAW
jgi:hypothetical protein